MRRYDEPVLPDVHYRPRPGAYGILALGTRLLLTHQSEPVPELQLPGGGIDAGESPVRALHREVLEETGWRISVLRRLGAYQRYTYMPEYDLWAHKICHIYLCRPTRRVSDPLEACHSVRWMQASQAVQALGNTGDRDFVRNFLLQEFI
jgi:8-oxo-dGTP diphosphatase